MNGELMQMMEAMISLLVLVSFLSVVASEQHTKPVNDSLYRYYLANDAWRVLYLKDALRDFSFDAHNPARNRAELELQRIGGLTGFCIFIGGERITNCRGEQTDALVSIERIAVVDGVPQTVMLTIAHKTS